LARYRDSFSGFTDSFYGYRDSFNSYRDNFNSPQDCCNIHRDSCTAIWTDLTATGIALTDTVAYDSYRDSLNRVRFNSTGTALTVTVSALRNYRDRCD
jgi:hypothetical protein